MPQLLQLLRSNKVGLTEAHWIAATLWNKALDHYAFPPNPPTKNKTFVATNFAVVVRVILRIVINGVNMLFQ